MLLDGLSTLTEKARFYRWLQAGVGSVRLWKWFIKTEILPHQPKRILDLGCGTGDILAYLPNNIEYIGIDPNQSYIDSAQSRYPSRGQWQCGPVTMDTVGPLGDFDMVLLLGVLHHCSDDAAIDLLRTAKSALKTGGVTLHLDGCLHAEASWFETMLYRLERGLYVRNQEGYAELMTQDFEENSQQVVDGLLRLPYRYCVGRGHNK